MSAKLYENSYAINISDNFFGLSKQLHILIFGIIKCIRDGKNQLIVGQFSLKSNPIQYCKCSNIIDFKELNKYLNVYNVKIVDGGNTIIKNINSYKLKFDNQFFMEEKNQLLAKALTQQIPFTNDISSPPNNFMNNLMEMYKIDPTQIKINVVHLRIEDDAVSYWAKYNKMNPTIYYNRLLNNYMELIKKHIDRKSFTIIISGKNNNEIVNYMKMHKYSHTYFTPPSDYQEVNATMNLILAKMCNNVFIGNTDSTYSLLLQNVISIDDSNVFLVSNVPITTPVQNTIESS